MFSLLINLLLQTDQLGSGKFSSTGESYLPAVDVFSSPCSSQEILARFNPGNEELLFPTTPHCFTPLKHRTGRNSVNLVLARKLFFPLLPINISFPENPDFDQNFWDFLDLSSLMTKSSFS